MDLIQLREEDLLLQLGNTENSFVERKTFSDYKDWLKTAVAFANSAPVGYPAILFIGVMNDGSPEPNKENLDSVQKKVGDRISSAYPPIFYLSKVLRIDEKEILAVIIPGSADRPHFAGPAYVRKDTRSVRASDEQFARLIAERNSKTYEILKWKGKPITVIVAYRALAGQMSRPQTDASVVDCNQFLCDAGSGRRPALSSAGESRALLRQRQASPSNRISHPGALN
jgi:predicted HTH transcriptional regulator